MAKRSEIELRTASELTEQEVASIEAQEMFVVQAQVTINRLMREHDVSQAELARRLGVSEARVSSMFSNDKNFTLRTIGRIIHALGEEAMLVTTREYELRESAAEIDGEAETISAWSIGDLDTVTRRGHRKSGGRFFDLSNFAANDRVYEQRHPALALAS